MRLEVRHIESGGVGYHDGYTTFAGFFSYVTNSWVPFLDVRAHVFDNGRPAANAGLGLRYVGHRVWGVNGYYDYRRSHHHSYNQGAFGLESLGVTWDFRANGYFPAGNSEGRPFDLDVEHFSGHRLILSQRQDFAMKGGNAEVGVHVNSICNLPLYFAAGPYYFKNEGKHAWGGEGRVALDYFEYLRLEAMASYDHIFRGKAQGQISLILPFGGRSSVVRKRCDDCCHAQWINERALQRVDRNEIIVIDDHKVKSNAINPRTGQPYHFLFVDNTSNHSDGTFEDPFATLLEAQAASAPSDVIYVFAGDHSSDGLDAGIILKDNQKLFGAGIDQRLTTTLGRVTIPSQQPGYPFLTAPGLTVITAANNNEISGLELLASHSTSGTIEIQLLNVNNASIHDNLFEVVGSQTAINLSGAAGDIDIRDNIFNLTTTNVNFTQGIVFLDTVAQANYLIEQNQFYTPAGNTTPIHVTGADFNSLIIQNNLFQGEALNSILGNFTGTGSLAIRRNLFTRTLNPVGQPDIMLTLLTPSMDVDVLNNLWTNSVNLTGTSVQISTLGLPATEAACVTLIGNLSDLVTPAYVMIGGSSGPLIVEGAVPNQNLGTFEFDGNAAPGICNTE
jgi:hypothetical protein